jgi:hypothetical protein
MLIKSLHRNRVSVVSPQLDSSKTDLKVVLIKEMPQNGVNLNWQSNNNLKKKVIMEKKILVKISSVERIVKQEGEVHA